MTKVQLMKALDNIWYHYKPHILIGILVFAALIPLIFFDKDQKSSALNVTVIGNTIGQKEQQALQKEASSKILKADSKSEIKLNFWQISGQITSSTNVDLYQKLLAQITAKNIDIILIDKSDFLLMSQQRAFIELDSIKKSNNDNTSNKYGLDITGNEILRNAGYDTENKMMVILSNTEKEETAIKFVQWIANQNP
ncbi:hypothetical protein [Neobacillus niacini]|uniref:hypothetical protein n=1 Tax=Neobacillus niacini TaxID=86668 RepID=UPI001269E8E9|nr:hypothetical protein [Neobacillus niacini]